MENFEAKQRYKLFFSDLPISNNSIKSLSKRNFNKMTEVQRCVIPHALVGSKYLREIIFFEFKKGILWLHQKLEVERLCHI